ncbi:hypothetical protein HNY73_019455 [Argiope bruennichi]|uniref:Uncharacterized protein n=1 Tax=Argiope bruennichi TaxID=94029 RepID=A0A8T0E4Y7_ARGBR|nr:hypothetical protein HNY73_019455 [Argiope bruennichi]
MARASRLKSLIHHSLVRGSWTTVTKSKHESGLLSSPLTPVAKGHATPLRLSLRCNLLAFFNSSTILVT